MWQNVSFVLIFAGILILIGWAARGFFLASEIPLLVRIAAGTISAGVLILIAVAIKDRLGQKKAEKFKEVER